MSRPPTNSRLPLWVSPVDRIIWELGGQLTSSPVFLDTRYPSQNFHMHQNDSSLCVQDAWTPITPHIHQWEPRAGYNGFLLKGANNMPRLVSFRAVVLNRGITYQISCPSAIYIMIHNRSRIIVIKKQSPFSKYSANAGNKNSSRPGNRHSSP